MRLAPRVPPQTEAHFQSQVVRLARQLGWRVFFTSNSKGSPPGWPDLVLVRPPHMLMWELKSERGLVTATQAETLDLLMACTELGVGVVRPADWDLIVSELRDPDPGRDAAARKRRHNRA